MKRGRNLKSIASLAALAFSLSRSPTIAVAADWGQVMAAEADAAVFLMDKGELVRSTFSLAVRETLWAPAQGRHVSRLLVGPDGRQVTWLTRAGARGPSELWVAGDEGPRPRIVFPSLVPGDLGSLHFEPEIPTLADPVIRGARLLAPGPVGRGMCSNALEWTFDGRGILCGSNRGLILAPSDSGAARLLSDDRIIEMRRLEPSPIYLGLLQQPATGDERRAASGALSPLERGGSPSAQEQAQGGSLESARGVGPQTFERRVLMYLAGGRPRLFDASGLDPSDVWTANEEKVWWIQQGNVRSVRANDPTPKLEFEGKGSVAWIEWDPRRRALHWTRGGRVSRRFEEGSRDSLVFEIGSPIRRVLAPASGNSRLLLTDSRLVLWDLSDDSHREFDLEGGLRIQQAFESDGKVLVTAMRGEARNAPLELHQLDRESGRLMAIQAPSLKGGRIVATPSGHHLILFRPGSKPPSSLQVFDVAGGGWTEVPDPGISAWEPVGD